ncbi:LOW QUALITY PROTEIN: orexin receptor type 2-like [Saccoglossus kowalevskii]
MSEVQARVISRTDFNTSNACTGEVNATNGCLHTNDTSDDFDSYDYYYNYVLPKLLENFVFPTTVEWVLISAYIVVFIVAICGNALVCYAVIRNHQMRTVTNYYILNLSVADTLVSMVCLPITMVVDATETWYFGATACKVVPYLQVAVMSVSVLTLSAIAVDRYFAICQPLMFKSTPRRAATVIVAIWLSSFIIPIPLAVVYETESRLPAFVYMTRCYEKGWHGMVQQKIYHIFLICAIFIVPLMLVTVAYTLVCRQLWASIPGSLESTDEKNAQAKDGGMNKSREGQIKSRRKVAKMMIVVVVIFAVCYLPLHILNVLRQFSVFEIDYASRHLFHVPFLIAHWLAFANSAVNPIIYNFLSAKFRHEFVTAFMCCCCCPTSMRLKYGRRTGRQGSNTTSNSKTDQIVMNSLRSSSTLT